MFGHQNKGENNYVTKEARRIREGVQKRGNAKLYWTGMMRGKEF